MDKNTIVGFVLIAAVLFGFNWFTRPSTEEIQEQRKQDSIAALVKKKEEIQIKKAQKKQIEAQMAALQDSTALFYSARQGQAKDIVLSNEKVAITLSTKGGTVTKAVIKNFKDRDDNKDVTLFEKKDQQLNFILSAKDMNIATADLYFTPSNVTKNSVTFTALASKGKTLEISYKLGDNYLLSCSVKANGMSGLFNPNTTQMDIDWKDRARQQEKGFTFENRYSTLTYHFADGGTDYLSETSEKIDEAIDEKTDWIAFKNQFFSAVMISKSGFASNALLSSVPYEKGEGYLKGYQAKLKTAFDPNGVHASEFEFYYGPNDFRLLQSVEDESSFGKDLQMERLVYLGWPLFRYINRWFTLYVFDWLTGLSIPMGIVLILITLLLKAITYPMVKKSYMSSAKMRVLKPRLEEATKQYNKPEDQLIGLYQ